MCLSADAPRAEKNCLHKLLDAEHVSAIFFGTQER